ncbi:hypothetical protein JCM13304A_13610 [Desulfothermus okinawensis JCM 13304]
MELKEKIKKEIDSLPEIYLLQLQQYIQILKDNKDREKKIKTVHFKGRFDNLNIRKIAYE